MRSTTCSVHTVVRYAMFAALVAACACGDDDSPQQQQTITQLVGPEGGTVELSGGGKVVIPADALTETVAIKITKLELEDVAQLPFNLVDAGKPYAFEPHGTTFLRAVKVELPFEPIDDDNATDVRPIKAEDEADTNWRTIVGSEKDDADKTLSFDVMTFSVLIAARPKRDSGVITLPDGAIVDEGDGSVMDSSMRDATTVDAATIDSSMRDASTIDAAMDATTTDSAIGTDAQTDSAQADASVVEGFVEEIALGRDHSCAVMQDSTVRCWGSNNTAGQLGNDTYADPEHSVAVLGIVDAEGISSATYSTCVLVNDVPHCWGFNEDGQLGDGTTATSLSPVTTTNVTNALQLAVSGIHACARIGDTTVRCWGRNTEGALGNNSFVNSPNAVTVSGLSDVQEIAAGNAGHTCVRLGDGSVSCWGYNFYGQLGDGSTNNSSVPLAVSGIGTATQLAMGGVHSCALLSDTTVECWGWNQLGQLGDGTVIDRPDPTEVTGLSDVLQIAAGNTHTCALVEGGNVICWGDNTHGQLGNGTFEGSGPDTVFGLTGARAVACGVDHTCVITDDNTVSCWGRNNHGQLGDGTTTDQPSPVTVIW